MRDSIDDRARPRQVERRGRRRREPRPSRIAPPFQPSNRRARLRPERLRRISARQPGGSPGQEGGDKTTSEALLRVNPESTSLG